MVIRNLKNYLFILKTDVIFEFCEQKYLEKVYLKLNLAQSTKQESPGDIPHAGVFSPKVILE